MDLESSLVHLWRMVRRSREIRMSRWFISVHLRSVYQSLEPRWRDFQWSGVQMCSLLYYQQELRCFHQPPWRGWGRSWFRESQSCWCICRGQESGIFHHLWKDSLRGLLSWIFPCSCSLNGYQILEKYTRMTGRPAWVWGLNFEWALLSLSCRILPSWSYGLWLSTSFLTSYSSETVSGFLEGMKQRDCPVRVFHLDCFWMKQYEWSVVHLTALHL